MRGRIDLQCLRIFLAVSDELGFRRAAAQIGVGQPVASRQIAVLEDELGVTRFERNGTGDVTFDLERYGVPGRIRTCGPKIRNLVLYPAELRGHA